MTCDPEFPDSDTTARENARYRNWNWPADLVVLALTLFILLSIIPKGPQKAREQWAEMQPATAAVALPTPSPTPLGLQLALPLAEFADRGAFLEPGGHVMLVGIAGGEVRVTAEARVVEVSEGTRPAVLLDVATRSVTSVQAYVAGANPGLQYIPATPVAAGSDE